MPDYHVDRPRQRTRRREGPRLRRQRLYRKAIQARMSCWPVCAPSCGFSRTARTRSSRIGPYTFRPAAKLLQEPAKNRRIRLTEKEAAILKFLYRAGTRSVARQVLLNEVWGYNAAVTTHTLETHIYRLRQKIEPDPANARLLVTEGGGYRLDPEGIPAPRMPAAAHA